MDNINIREYIVNNFKNNNSNEIKESIEKSIKDGDEVTLPGLGVFFELLWSNCDDDLKMNILSTLEISLK